MAADSLAETIRALVEQELRRQQGGTPARTFEDGLAEGRAQGRAEAAGALRKLAASLTTSTPLDPPAAPPQIQPPDAANPSRIREPQSLPARKQRVRDYLASHPGARYRALSDALGQYVATAVYALEKAGEVTKDENRGFWLKSHGVQQSDAQDDPDHHRSAG